MGKNNKSEVIAEMKFARNLLASLTITGFFCILSIVIPFLAVYALFHPEEAVNSCLLIFFILLAAVALNVLAEFMAWCRRNHSFFAVILEEKELWVQRRAKSKMRIKYSDIKCIAFDMGFIPTRHSRGKFSEPRIELLGEKGESLLAVTSPSLLMLYRIKKKAPHAKISHNLLCDLLFPAAFTLLYLLIFTISALC